MSEVTAAGGGRGLTFVGYKGLLGPQEGDVSTGCPVAAGPGGCSMVQIRDGGPVTGTLGLTMSWQLARAIASDRLSRQGARAVTQCICIKGGSAASVRIRTDKVHNPQRQASALVGGNQGDRQ